MKKVTEQDFPFGAVMESMQGKELKERITKAWNWEMDKLSLVPYIGGIEQVVEYKYPELTARCPVTGIQDLYTVTIRFIPDKTLPELKSLKLYFMSYRDLPISHEHLQAKIFKDFNNQIQPKKLNVNLEVAVRGGIYTTIEYGDKI